MKKSPQTQIGIENGYNDGANRQGLLGISGGSVGVHWDKHDMDNELLTFRITDNPVLSIVTLGSLRDMNYIVDLSFAYPFVDPFLNGGSGNQTDQGSDEEEGITMIDDVVEFTLMYIIHAVTQ